jgi:hypothetical protein
VSEVSVAANDNQCDYGDPKRWLLKIALFACGCGLITWGWWSISTIASRRTWVIGHGTLGIVLIVAGFLSINFGLGILPERVSTASGIDASTCYSRVENVSVLTIVVPELKPQRRAAGQTSGA